jgi:hypothetical protein
MSHYTRIRTSMPINRQTAIVAAPGVAWAPAVQVDDWIDEVPETMTPSYQLRQNDSWKDHTGKKFGQLTVLGLHRSQTQSGRTWACRCSCGGHCLRSTKELHRVGDPNIHMCGLCRYKRKLFKPRDGRPVLTEELIECAIARVREQRARPTDAELLADAAELFLRKALNSNR